MSGPIRLKPPLSDEDAERLKIGDRILINGIIYTGRDAAHKRLFDLLKEGKNLPFDIKGQIIYYVGPTPAKPGQALGSAGPTTSYRMDAYSPSLIERGLKGMIGKGMRSDAVKEAMKRVLRAVNAAREDGLSIDVSGMDEFDIGDFGTELEDAQKLLSLGLASPTLKKQVFKKLAFQFLCDVRQEVKDRIGREIDREEG